MDARILIEVLQKNGHRVTKARSALLSILDKKHSPLSAMELQKLLERKGIIVNKTTIYREIDFLIAQNIIHSVALGDEATRYELSSRDHHHHIQCTSCGNVVDLPLNNELKEIEKQITRGTGYMIEKHALEFFGLCKNCQK
ncbi:MAG: transcriptional repressor [Candidatus Kerfeldbacteria bacterium]|nr:transcriptional repressor [Candidatus Kerfeldbacteria bacterium]